MAVVTQSVQIEPYFDMELFLSTSQETRIGGELMEKLSACWDAWIPHAKAMQITVDDAAYLLVWLEKEVEDAVDEAWDKTPSDAFAYNALAQVICMTMVHAALPMVEEAGCAPAPAPSACLAEGLEKAGVPYADGVGPTLSRRYAVVTHHPFRGGCEVCSLREQCPKGSGCGSEAASVTLPGYDG